MNVLVVGGSGFFGKNLVDHLAKNSQHHVYATYWSDRTFPNFAYERDVEPLCVDLRNQESVRRIVDCELAIYVAGSSNSFMTPRQAIDDLGLLANFLESYRGKLVYVTSGGVYYPLRGVMCESTSITPRYPYGLAKYGGERLVEHAFLEGLLTQFVILRAFYTFGRWERETRLVRRTIDAFLDGKPITLRAQGTLTLDPLDSGDVAHAIHLAAFDEKCNGLILNVCRGEPYTVKRLAQTIADTLGTDAHFEYDHRPEPLDIGFWGSPYRFQQLTGFSPKPLDQSIRDYSEWLAFNRVSA